MATDRTELRESPPTTSLFEAQHEGRYERQRIIKAYEEKFGVSLIVMIDQIVSYAPTVVAELLADVDPGRDLHMMLATPGGDGEVAVRLMREVQEHSARVTMVVPDMAKSAGTIMCLGADEILMGPSSDLGPIDPQLRVNKKLISARQIEAAIQSAEERIQSSPATYPLYSSLLADVDMLLVESARSATNRSYDVLLEALSCADRDSEECETLAEKLKGPLIDGAHYHGATFGPKAALEIGLPVTRADVHSEQWKIIWRLWTRYFNLGAFPAGPTGVYESRRASQILRE